MQRQPNELFTTLHQLASTFTTVFEVLADARPEDRRTEPRPAPAAVPDEPAPPPTSAKEPPRGNTCLACGGACDEPSARVKAGRICGTCIGASLIDLQGQAERAHLEDIAYDIRDRLAAFDRLIAEAMDGDGARTLPILDAELLRLVDMFRTRSGCFASPPPPPFCGEPGTFADRIHEQMKEYFSKSVRT